MSKTRELIMPPSVKYVFWSLLFFCCFCSSPRGDEINKINVSPNNLQNVDLSQVAEIRIIPLETKEGGFIDGYCHVYYTHSFLFVVTMRKVFQFSHQGKFIKTIGGAGKGPGEYIGFFTTFTVDEKQRKVFLGNYTNGIMVYSYEGDFIQSFPLSGAPDNIHVEDSFINVFYPHFGAKKNTHLLYSFTPSGILQDSAVLRTVNVPYRIWSGPGFGTQYISSVGKKRFFIGLLV